MLSKKFTAVAGAAEPTDLQFNYVTMLLTGDGTNGAQNNTFTDSSSNAFSITRNGNTTQGTFSPYGNNWSINYPALAYMTYAANPITTFGAGATFTVEAWVNISAYPNTNYFFSLLASCDQGTATYWAIGIGSTGLASVYWYDGSPKSCAGSTTLAKETWYHVAVVVTSGVVKIYVNGVSETLSGTTTITNPTGNSSYTTGTERGSSNGSSGTISNLRTNTGALYSTNFTPSTTPLTNVANTTLLTAQSNRFIDNSSSARTITTSSTKILRFSPFNPTAAYTTATIGGSGYFDGSGDYLSATGTDIALGSGDFTAEFWVNGSYSGTKVLLDWAGTPQLYMSNTSIVWYWTSARITGTLVQGGWSHVAIVRSSGVTKMYINGVANATTWSDTTNLTQQTITIGGRASDAANTLSGYISNVRLVKGTAVYTSDFTPPSSPLTAITNTSLLLNMTNAGIPDSAMMNDLETFGNAQVSTSVKKYGTGSLAFDGSDVLVSNAPSTDLCAFGTGDYTIEMWVYFVNASTLGVFYDSRPTLTNGFYPTLYVSSGNIYFYFNSANEGSAAVSTGQWYHLAVCRSSGTVKMFLNGTQSATWADTRAYSNGSGRPYVGGSGYGGGVGDGFNGYIDDLRVTKGYARYTSNFTAPTAALPNY